MNNDAPPGNTFNLRNPICESERKSLAQIDLENAKAEAELLRKEAVAANEKAETMRASLVRSKRDAKFRLRTAAVVMLSAALLKIAWQSTNQPTPSPTPMPAQGSLLSPAALSAPAEGSKAGSAEIADQSSGALALESLRSMFHSIPDEDQEDIVREVNDKYAGAGLTCPLEWKDGVPALSLGAQSGASMVVALNRCAAGIEKLRLERDRKSAKRQ